jgi:RHH-type proline utilization regulon transcriptional repressor/proline dehydrogenase/delta 1-pyrroline-5-carboxylate dehydrogenase
MRAYLAAKLPTPLLQLDTRPLENLLIDENLQGICYDGLDSKWRQLRQALAQREGARLPILTSEDDLYLYTCERVISIDTTAAGGNASLLAG